MDKFTTNSNYDLSGLFLVIEIMTHSINIVLMIAELIHVFSFYEVI